MGVGLWWADSFFSHPPYTTAGACEGKLSGRWVDWCFSESLFPGLCGGAFSSRLILTHSPPARSACRPLASRKSISQAPACSVPIRACRLLEATAPYDQCDHAWRKILNWRGPAERSETDWPQASPKGGAGGRHQTMASLTKMFPEQVRQRARAKTFKAVYLKTLLVGSPFLFEHGLKAWSELGRAPQSLSLGSLGDSER
jgi:hypothetical protein